MGIADHQDNSLQATLDEAFKEVGPGGLVLRVAYLHAQEVPFALGVHALGDEHAVTLHFVVPADLLVAGVDEDVGIRFIKRPIEPTLYLTVQPFADGGYLRPGEVQSTGAFNQVGSAVTSWSRWHAKLLLIKNDPKAHNPRELYSNC